MLRVWATPSLGFIMEASLRSLVSVLIIKKNFSMKGTLAHKIRPGQHKSEHKSYFYVHF